MTRREFEALRQRATQEEGERFAESVCEAVEGYRSIEAGDWPAWPTPAAARAEAKRIQSASTELLSAIRESSEALRARLKTYLQVQSMDLGAPRSQTAIMENIEFIARELAQAADTIYCEQPATRRKDITRHGFLVGLRECFRQQGAQWSSTADEYGGTSLAVDAVAAALSVTPATASKAIQRIDESDA